MYIWTRRLYWEYYICMNACMYVCIMYVCMSVLQSARHSARRSLIGALIGALCGVAVYVLRIYVYMDAPIILGVLYMYECIDVCMYYVCMRLCTPIGAPFGAPIAIRRADRRHVCCRCVSS